MLARSSPFRRFALLQKMEMHFCAVCRHLDVDENRDDVRLLPRNVIIIANRYLLDDSISI